MLLEKSLLLERIEREILRQRVDEILVGHRRGSLFGFAARERGREQRLQLGTVVPETVAVRIRQMMFDERLDDCPPIPPLVIFLENPEPFDAAQHEVEAP